MKTTNYYFHTYFLYRFLVLNSFHLHIIFDQLIHIGDNSTSLNVHQNK